MSGRIPSGKVRGGWDLGDKTDFQNIMDIPWSMLKSDVVDNYPEELM